MCNFVDLHAGHFPEATGFDILYIIYKSLRDIFLPTGMGFLPSQKGR